MRQLSMATATVQRTIKEHTWSLVAFAKEFGPKVQIAKCHNKETGDSFKCVAFGEGEALTFVAFSSNLGELTPNEIAARKNDLQVVQFEESGNYCLCKVGSSWEQVDLGL